MGISEPATRTEAPYSNGLSMSKGFTMDLRVYKTTIEVSIMTSCSSQEVAEICLAVICASLLLLPGKLYSLKGNPDHVICCPLTMQISYLLAEACYLLWLSWTHVLRGSLEAQAGTSGLLELSIRPSRLSAAQAGNAGPAARAEAPVLAAGHAVTG